MIEFQIGDFVELSDIDYFPPTGWIRNQTFPLRVVDISYDTCGVQIIYLKEGFLGYYSRHFKLYNKIQFIND